MFDSSLPYWLTRTIMGANWSGADAPHTPFRIFLAWTRFPCHHPPETSEAETYFKKNPTVLQTVLVDVSLREDSSGEPCSQFAIAAGLKSKRRQMRFLSCSPACQHVS
jgi:hypothetical protein